MIATLSLLPHWDKRRKSPSHLRRQRNNPSGRSSKLEIIVVLVRPDPEPVVMAFAFASESTIAATNLDGVNAAFLAET